MKQVKEFDTTDGKMTSTHGPVTGDVQVNLVG